MIYLKRYQKLLFRAFLSIAICFFIINIAAPSQSMSPAISFADMQSTANEKNLTTYEQQAKSVLMGQRNVFSKSESSSLKSFVAVLSGKDIYPSSAATPALGAVMAVLDANRLAVRGGFDGLSSSLRDYATDPPVPPNPNVISPVHIHRGTATENGPFQYALEVQVDPDGLGGSVKGEYTLTEEQLQALNDGRLYVDLHTKDFRGGELRGIFSQR